MEWLADMVGRKFSADPNRDEVQEKKWKNVLMYQKQGFNPTNKPCFKVSAFSQILYLAH